MRPMLDDLELPLVQEIRSYDQRALAEHSPPGLPGTHLQNMGRAPAHLLIWGVATGPGELDFVEQLDDKFKRGDPLPFTADITADAEIDQMIIETLRWQEIAGHPQRQAYIMTLREYIEPVEPEDLSLLDSDILADAQSLIDDLVDGLDIGLDFATGLERFVSPLTDFLSRLEAFNRGNGQ
ncbi:MAG: hypothetical protein QNJ45_08550 [Ardenticatenaceae bacterium]|nr:hypothetical protein [Ardenticatenaceae bacterium]